MVSRLGVGVIKKKRFFHDMCLGLGIELHEDEFDFTYLQSLSIYLLDVEAQWGALFELQEIRKAFAAAAASDDLTEVARLLDHHLHVTIKQGPLKELNAVPASILENFVVIYRKQVLENATPVHKEQIRLSNEILDNQVQQYGNLMGVLETIKNQQTVSLDNYMLRGDVEQLIDKVHQGELDGIKKAFENYQFRFALKSLLAFKERIWNDTTDNIRFKVLNNIGYAHILLNKYDEAIPFYEQAVTYNGEHAGNLSSLAGLYLMRNRYVDAQPIAEKLEESHPSLKVAIDLYQIPAENLPEDLETLVPEHLRDVPELLVALINICHKTFPRSALKYATRLYNLKTESDNFIDIYCNTVCSTLIRDHIDFQTTELLSDEDKAHLQLAKKLLNDQLIKVGAQNELRVPLLEKLNIVTTVLGDQNAALAIADEILHIDPANYYALKQSGINLMFLHRFEDAAKRFGRIGSEHPQLYEFHTSWLIALGKTSQLDEAKRVGFKLLDNPDTPGVDRMRIYSTLAFMCTEHQQFDDAIRFIDQALALYPESIGLLADKAKALRGKADLSAAQAIEADMFTLIDSKLADQNFRDRYLAASYLQEHGKPKAAADLLETIANTQRNNFLTYQLLEAWMRSGQKAKALSICASLRDRYGYDAEYTLKEVSIYYHYHDYGKAEQLLSEYVRQFPDDLTAQLNLAGLYHRNKNFTALREFCEADLSRFKFRGDQLWGYVEILRGAGYYERCLRLLYEYRRANSSFEANKMFISFCLTDPGEKEHTKLPDQVGTNMAVTLVSGNTNFCYIILEKPTEELVLPEINAQSPIYQTLKDKKIGDRVALQPNDRERWEITKILPLYTHVFQEAMHQNTTIYAAESGIISGEVHELEDLTQLMGNHFSDAEKFAEMMQEQEQNYEAYLLPLNAYAIFNRTSPINVYEHFSRKCGIRAAIGNVDEYQQAVNAATAAFCPDITALLTLFKIGFQRPATMPKFIIPHGTHDMIYNHIGKKGLRLQTDDVSLGVQYGQQIRYITTAEVKQKEHARLKVFESWINANCETRPCKTLLDYDTAKWQRFKKTIGSDVFETALLALENNSTFVCDDHATRKLFEEELKIIGVWTQPALQSLIGKQIIFQHEAYDYFVALIKLKHRHTTVNRDTILYFLEKSHYRVDENVTATVDILSGYYSNESSVQIAFAIIAELANRNLPAKQFEQLSYYLLMRFLSGRTVFPIHSTFFKLSTLYIPDDRHSWILKHAIFKLVTDHGLLSYKTIRTWGQT